jgi:hypothetical protein
LLFFYDDAAACFCKGAKAFEFSQAWKYIVFGVGLCMDKYRWFLLDDTRVFATILKTEMWTRYMVWQIILHVLNLFLFFYLFRVDCLFRYGMDEREGFYDQRSLTLLFCFERPTKDCQGTIWCSFFLYLSLVYLTKDAFSIMSSTYGLFTLLRMVFDIYCFFYSALDDEYGMG